MKTCTKCNRLQPLDNFHKEKKAKGGHASRCKQCANIYYQQYYSKNQQHVKDVVSSYRNENRDNILAKRRLEYRENQHDHYLAQKAYRKANKGATNARCAKRRSARLQATPNWLTEDHNRQINNLYTLAAETQMQVDHVVPLQNEIVCGLHVPWNLQLLTSEENQIKKNHFHW